MNAKRFSLAMYILGGILLIVAIMRLSGWPLEAKRVWSVTTGGLVFTEKGSRSYSHPCSGIYVAIVPSPMGRRMTTVVAVLCLWAGRAARRTRTKADRKKLGFAVMVLALVYFIAVVMVVQEDTYRRSVVHTSTIPAPQPPWWSEYGFTRRLALDPLFPANLLLAATLIWLGYHVVRTNPSHPPGRCQACGYNLRGLREPRCPECGTPFGAASRERS